jgi:methionyl-tRNA formyltransferase
VLSSTFEVALVVTRPPNTIAKNVSARPSPVHKIANDSNIPVLIPDKASDPDFIKAMSDLKPDLCITAAYGNYLPANFLNIPKFGTL